VTSGTRRNALCCDATPCAAAQRGALRCNGCAAMQRVRCDLLRCKRGCAHWVERVRREERVVDARDSAEGVNRVREPDGSTNKHTLGRRDATRRAWPAVTRRAHEWVCARVGRPRRRTHGYALEAAGCGRRWYRRRVRANRWMLHGGRAAPGEGPGQRKHAVHLAANRAAPSDKWALATEPHARQTRRDRSAHEMNAAQQ
jgi:hypothetical protein